MKVIARFIAPVLFVGLAGVPVGHFGQASAQVIQWDIQPPNGYNDIGRRAFHDGLEAAHHDWDAHHDMDPWHYPQVRNPPVPGPERDHYRSAFLRGYDEGYRHAQGWDRDHDDHWRDHDHDHGYNPH
jgi:hypothetical protein